MTQPEKDIERIYYVLYDLNPDDIKYDDIQELADVVNSTRNYTKENIEFYMYSQNQATQILHKVRLIQGLIDKLNTTSYVLDLTHTDRELYYKALYRIKLLALHIENLYLSYHFIHAKAIALRLITDNDFKRVPDSKSLLTICKAAEKKYHKKYKVLVSADSIRKAYIRLFNDNQVFEYKYTIYSNDFALLNKEEIRRVKGD